MSEVTVESADYNVNVEESVYHVTVTSRGPQGPRGSSILSGSEDPSIVVGLIGDHYINTSSGMLFGPKTSGGWGNGILLSVGADSLGQMFEQETPSDEWTIIHTLTFIPNILIVDSENNIAEGDYEFVGSNTIIATFSNPIAGTAYLS